MNPRVKSVRPLNNFELEITFQNDEVRLFDMKPLLNIGVFKQLQDWNIFKKVQPFLGSIRWTTGQDLCPDTLYLESKILDS